MLSGSILLVIISSWALSEISELDADYDIARATLISKFQNIFYLIFLNNRLNSCYRHLCNNCGVPGDLCCSSGVFAKWN